MSILILNLLAVSQGDVPSSGDFGFGVKIEKADALINKTAEAVGIAWKVFFIVAVLFIILAAFEFLTAAENAEKIKSAKKQILYASIAIVIAFLSLSAQLIIENFLQGKGEQTTIKNGGVRVILFDYPKRD